MKSEIQKLKAELESAHAALRASEIRYSEKDKELKENRTALLFMLEDLERARKNIETAHHEWMDALDVISDPIFLHDKNYRILRCNLAYQVLAGLPLVKIIGTAYQEVFPISNPPCTCCRLNEREASTSNIVVGDSIYRSRAFIIRNSEGEYVNSLHVLEDITKNKSDEDSRRCQEAHEILTLSSPEIGTWEWDVGTGEFRCNQRWAEIRGFDLLDIEPDVSSWEKGIHPDDYNELQAKLADYFRRYSPLFQAEFRVQSKLGKWVWVLCRGVIVQRGIHGEPLRIVGTEMDITNRKQVEAKFLRQNSPSGT